MVNRKRLDFTWKPGLPSRRSALGALLITAAAVGTFSAAGADGSDEPSWWLAADRDLRQGQALGNGDLRSVPLDGPAAVTDALVPEEESVEGAVLLGPVAEGDLLAASALGPSGNDSGYEVTIEVPEAQALGGHLSAGETVDILATEPAGADPHTAVAASSALVLGVSETGSAGVGGRPARQVSLRLDDPGQVLATTHGAQVAELTFVRTGAGSDSLAEVAS